MGFVDMGYDSGDFRPNDRWRGFVVDLLAWVATHANFTYTLHASRLTAASGASRGARRALFVAP